jgi:hypothetical protein
MAGRKAPMTSRLAADPPFVPLEVVQRIHYVPRMDEPQPLMQDQEAAAEARALAEAIAESDADPRSVPHDQVRAWLLKLAQGEFDAPPPQPG